MPFDAHRLTARYLGRACTLTDGVDAARVASCEQRLGRRLPESLRELYLSVGNVPDLVESHHRVLPLEEVSIQGEHLVFMDENQSVVSWGIPLANLDEANPVIWQRNNTPPVAWFSEEKDLVSLMTSMWDWYVDNDLLEDSTEQRIRRLAAEIAEAWIERVGAQEDFAVWDDDGDVQIFTEEAQDRYDAATNHIEAALRRFIDSSSALDVSPYADEATTARITTELAPLRLASREALELGVIRE